MDLNTNVDKKITETEYLQTLWSIFEQLEIKLPIHSMDARIKFDGAIIYWLRFISK